MESPSAQRVVCKKGNTVWAEFDFAMNNFEEASGSPKTSRVTTAAKYGEAKHRTSPRASEGDKKKSPSAKSSRDGESKKDEKGGLSPEQRSSRKSKKSSDDKNSRDTTPTKREPRRLTKESSTRSRSPSVASRRREKALGSVLTPQARSPEKVLKTPKTNKVKKEKDHRSREASETPSRRRDSTETPTRRRPIAIESLSSSRTRAVQRAEARNSWREGHSVPKEASMKSGSSGNGVDDSLDEMAQRRPSLLDTSRKGPIRVSSRMRSKSEDDDDDDFSVLSASTSSFRHDDCLEAPFPSGQLRDAGSYLPNFLSAPATPAKAKQGRRPSAFGSGLDRAHAIYNFRPDESDDDESCSGGSVYSLPNGLARNIGSQVEKGGGGHTSDSARRPSLNSVLTMPIVNGSNKDLSSSEHGRSEKSERSDKSKKSRIGSSTADDTSPKQKGSEKCSEQDDKKGAKYDGAVDDMLKSRRLRGARGDGVQRTGAKKKEEKPATHRKLSLKVLANLVQPKSHSQEVKALHDPSATRRPSRM